ncbi:MAG: hypothetical protein AB1696_05630 [Planctomycetota bacterium]
MRSPTPIFHPNIVVAVLSCACMLSVGPACADVIGAAKTIPDFASFRVRRITVQIKGSAENAELAIPESAMFPLDVILEIRRKGYELLAEVPDGHPPAGTLGVVYEITRQSKGGGAKAAFEVKVTGQIFLRATEKDTLLWGVKVEAKEITDKSEKLTSDVIMKLVAGFYKGAFKDLPPAPKYKMVVAAPYRFRERITREPLRLPQDTSAVGRTIRGIAGDRWEGGPRPIHDAAPGGGDPLVQMWNDSEEQLTICYQGVSDAEIILAPGARLAFRLAEGYYKIGARTAAPDITPFYNSETLKAQKVYSVRFAISEEGY